MGELMTLTELVSLSHGQAVKSGWHTEPRSFGDLIALIHSELSEALEEFRAGHQPHVTRLEEGKPEGVPVELADVLIRIGDLCGRYGIDLERVVFDKMAYNATRPHRHGGKVL